MLPPELVAVTSASAEPTSAPPWDFSEKVGDPSGNLETDGLQAAASEKDLQHQQIRDNLYGVGDPQASSFTTNMDFEHRSEVDILGNPFYGYDWSLIA